MLPFLFFEMGLKNYRTIVTENSIKVLGANQISPNQFIYKPRKRSFLDVVTCKKKILENQNWFVKYSAVDCKEEGNLAFYVNVEEFKTRKILKWTLYFTSITLLLLGLILSILHYTDFTNGLPPLELCIGEFTISIPIILIILSIIWSKKITALINRLSSFKEKKEWNYDAKAIKNNAIEVRTFEENSTLSHDFKNSLTAQWKTSNK